MAQVSWEQGRRKSLTIPQAAQETDVLYMGSLGMRAAYRLGILMPDTLTGVVTIDVAMAAEGPFRTLQSDNVDITLSAGKAAVLDPVPFPHMRFVSTLAEDADRVFTLVAHAG